MPVMANITVKKNDGTTDIVYTAMTPSSGDNSQAQWRAEAAATVAAFKPRFELRSRFNEAKTGRRLDGHFVYPITELDAASGLTKLKGSVPGNFSIVLPLDCSDTIVSEAVSQMANLLVSTLIKDSCKSGYAPT